MLDIPLVPPLNKPLRVGLLVVLLIPLLFARFPSGSPLIRWAMFFLSFLLPLALTGTYRQSWIQGEWFETRFYFGFVPVTHQRCKLASVAYIDTKCGASQTGWATLAVLGPVMFIFGHIFDFLLPALGGAYELWVVTGKGREINAWQGYSQKHFEANMDLLRNHTSAELRAR